MNFLNWRIFTKKYLVVWKIYLLLKKKKAMSKLECFETLGKKFYFDENATI